MTISDEVQEGKSTQNVEKSQSEQVQKTPSDKVQTSKSGSDKKPSDKSPSEKRDSSGQIALEKRKREIEESGTKSIGKRIVE